MKYRYFKRTMRSEGRTTYAYYRENTDTLKFEVYDIPDNDNMRSGWSHLGWNREESSGPYKEISEDKLHKILFLEII